MGTHKIKVYHRYFWLKSKRLEKVKWADSILYFYPTYYIERERERELWASI